MNKAAVESDANQHDINKWFPLKIIGERKRIIYILCLYFLIAMLTATITIMKANILLNMKSGILTPAKAPRTAPGINAMAMYKLCLMSL